MLDTPIPQLELALQGKLDFVRRTNPFGGKKGKGRNRSTGRDVAPPEPRDGRPSKSERAEVAGQLKAILGGMARKKGGMKPAQPKAPPHHTPS